MSDSDEDAGSGLQECQGSTIDTDLDYKWQAVVCIVLQGQGVDVELPGVGVNGSITGVGVRFSGVIV